MGCCSAVSTWLSAGVDPATVAEWAGHSLSVLIAIYAACRYGKEVVSRRRWATGETTYPDSVLLTYVDESYCKTCYYVVALICPEDEAHPLTAALNDVMAGAALSYTGRISPEAELHGHDIFQGKRDWADMKELVRARIGIYDKALQAIADRDVSVIIRGVMSERLMARYGERAYHPHTVALTQLLERVDLFAEERDQLALVIADEPGQADQQPEYRADLRTFQDVGTWGYRSRRIERVVDTLHFAPSSESRLLQAVDLIAFLYHRIATTKSGTDMRQVRANRKLWARIDQKVWHRYLWRP